MPPEGFVVGDSATMQMQEGLFLNAFEAVSVSESGGAHAFIVGSVGANPSIKPALVGTVRVNTGVLSDGTSLS